MQHWEDNKGQKEGQSAEELWKLCSEGVVAAETNQKVNKFTKMSINILNIVFIFYSVTTTS